jgi:hypothetical protein
MSSLPCFGAKHLWYGSVQANMRMKYLIILSLLILLLLVAIRRESDSSVRFIKRRNEIAKPQSGSQR